MCLRTLFLFWDKQIRVVSKENIRKRILKSERGINMSVSVKSSKEIELMRTSCKILAEVHEKLRENLKPGMSTLDVDILAERFIREADCIPNFLHYNGFPGSVCVSINE